jgi:hypothetical protein
MRMERELMMSLMHIIIREESHSKSSWQVFDWSMKRYEIVKKKRYVKKELVRLVQSMRTLLVLPRFSFSLCIYLSFDLCHLFLATK